MRIVVAMDAWKGSLTSDEANGAVARAFDEGEVVTIPMSDGGEGFLDAWHAMQDGHIIEEEQLTLDETLRTTRFGWDEATRHAIIEVAEASGIQRVERLNPLFYSSYGTGVQIRQALDRGAQKITVGLGGSGTIDGGKGVLEALGVRFMDASGNVLPTYPHAIDRVASIDWSGLHSAVRDVQWRMASDVTNPLCGLSGAVYTFGQQKGVSRHDMERFDSAMKRYASCFEQDTMQQIGAGAAGGIGFALLQLGASVHRGIDEVMAWSRFDQIIETADWLITGEGRFDEQTLYGKAPFGLAKRAQRYGVPTIVFTGQSTMTSYREAGILTIIPVVSYPMTETEAFRDASTLLTAAVRRIIPLLQKQSDH